MLASIQRRWRILAILPILLALAGVGAIGTTGIAHAALSSHDNTTGTAHIGRWTHGDPNTGLIPGSTSDGYYYIDVSAGGQYVWCEVYSAGNWQVQLIHGGSNMPVVAQSDFHGTGGRVAITNATPGDEYRCRISNISPSVAHGGQVQKDYAELNSANSSDVMTTGDCGGPGPNIDPNFFEDPMEPAAADPFPNGCATGPDAPHGDAAPVAGDPRLSPPTSESFDLGPAASGGRTYTITTHYRGDITAVAFIGNTGTNGTLTIENSSGQVVNGQKPGGIKTANPNTQNAEFVGADAGIQPAGTYRVVYNGPTNSGHDVYALNDEYPQPGSSGSGATAPGAPTGLTATPGNGTSNLSWTAPSSNGGANITGYDIYRGTSPGGEGATPIATNVSGTSFTDTGLTDGIHYYYTVQAVNAAGNSPSSNEASDIPAAAVPSAPQNLTATGGNQQVTLSWQAPSSDGGSSITGYNVYRGTVSGQESLIASNVSGTSYTDTGLGLGTQYFYEVAAVNSAGLSPDSSEASATTSAPTSEPTAPQSLTATPGTGQVALTWQAPASNGGSAITGYNVYRGTASGAETLLAGNMSGTSYTDSAVTGGTQYFYKVTAVNANGESADSNEASATPAGSGSATVPGAPTRLAAAPGNGTVSLSWTVPADNGGSPIIGYDVYRATTSGNELAIGNSTTTSFADTGLANGTTYYYEVSAVNAAGQSADSSEVSVTPASDGTGTFSGSLSDYHSDEYPVTPTGSTLSANLSFTGADEQLEVLDSTGARVGNLQSGSSPLSDTVTVTPGSTYNVKVKDYDSGSTSYTVTITG